MAKILARTDGSHEMVGGARVAGMKSKFTASAAVSGSSTSDRTKSTGNNTSGRTSNVSSGSRSEGVEDERDNLEVSDSWYEGGKEGQATGTTNRTSSSRQRDAYHAPREGGELRDHVGRKAATEPETTAAAVEQRHHGALEQNVVSVNSNTGGSGTAGGGTGIPKKVLKKTEKKKGPGALSRPTKTGATGSATGPAAAAAAGDTGARCPSSSSSASRVRSFRRRLERLAARAAAGSAPKEGGHDGADYAKEDAKRASEFLLSLHDRCGGASLKELFGDGITAELLVGVTRGLRYACGVDAVVARGRREEEGEDRSNNADGVRQVRWEVAL